MAVSTYRDLITGSLRLIGVIGDGEAPSAFQAQNALDTLNEILDLWNSCGLLVYSTNFYALPLTGAATYTLGPGGAINVPVRPATINGAWVRYGTGASQADIQLTVVDASEWGSIRSKNMTSNLPQAVYNNGDWPVSTLSLYPVPTTGTLVLLLTSPLSASVGLDDTESLPPAYRMALRAEIAVYAAPEYGLEASPTVQLMAERGKNAITMSNFDVDRLDFDPILLGSPRYWIYSDGL